MNRYTIQAKGERGIEAFDVVAPNWNEARKSARIGICEVMKLTFVSCRLKGRVLQEHIGKPVVFEQAGGKRYKGTYWGILLAVSKTKALVNVSGTKAFHVEHSAIQLTYTVQ